MDRFFKTNKKHDLIHTDNNKILTVEWVRLVVNENTCPRCNNTEDELDKAVFILENVLKPLNINLQVIKKSLSQDVFDKNPIISNRIRINNRNIEDILSGTIGESKCCSVCGENNCRTIKINGITHEVITTKIILKAALIASAELIPINNMEET